MADYYTKKADLVAREVAGETLVVPIRGRLADMDNIYALNPVAAHVWKLLDERCAIADIVSGVTAEFEVSAKDAEADARQFLEELLSAGLIEVQADD